MTAVVGFGRQNRGAAGTELSEEPLAVLQWIRGCAVEVAVGITGLTVLSQRRIFAGGAQDAVAEGEFVEPGVVVALEGATGFPDLQWGAEVTAAAVRVGRRRVEREPPRLIGG